jgi:hypothetical protein
MPVSYKSGSETISVVQPVLKHYHSIESVIHYQCPTLICKLKDFMNGVENNRVLSGAARFFMTERFQ